MGAGDYMGKRSICRNCKTWIKGECIANRDDWAAGILRRKFSFECRFPLTGYPCRVITFFQYGGYMEEKETRNLYVKLNDEEVRAKGLELSAEVSKLKAAENDLKSVSKSMKDDIDLIKKKIDILADIVGTSKEKRDVECLEIRNNTLMTMEIYRTDTHELVETRPMSMNERQLSMFPVGNKLHIVPDNAPENEDEVQPDPAEGPIPEGGVPLAGEEDAPTIPSETPTDVIPTATLEVQPDLAVNEADPTTEPAPVILGEKPNAKPGKAKRSMAKL